MDSDVVVVGSGGAGLTAALVAADSGLSVTVLERAPFLGGTTAVSGGQLWVPNNHHMSSVDAHDSAEDALAYLERVTCDAADARMLQAFAHLAPDVASYLERSTPARFYVFPRPDYHPEFPGARRAGRVLDLHPLSPDGLDRATRAIRTNPHGPPVTAAEQRAWRQNGQYDHELIRKRTRIGVRTKGAALVAALVHACAKRGVLFRTGVRATHLLVVSDRVVGVIAPGDGRTTEYRAGRGVVLAAGGFEWNAAMKMAFLAGPEENPVSPPWNEGDALSMALEVGAAVDNMTQAWWYPTFNIPGETYDGRPLARMLSDERSLPGSIMINGAGRRFVNEAMNYNDVSKAFHVFDPGRYTRPNVPAWLVFDARFKKRYTVATVPASDQAPVWFQSGTDLTELAKRIDVDAAGLVETVRVFNTHAAEGRDPEFYRGESEYDRFQGDDANRPNPCLGPIVEPPFFALAVVPGSLGTKGGPRTDAAARVLNWSGTAIEGLYACGNAAASMMGPGYPGAGGTLAPALAFAYACGRDLAAH